MRFSGTGAFWILDENKDPRNVGMEEAFAWASKGFEKTKRVAETTVNRRKDIRVSTVFLGVDHSIFGGPPVLFETMVFGGGMDLAQRRYCTWKEALHGHARMVGYVRRARQCKLRNTRSAIRGRKLFGLNW